ncbi:hypothetical protein QG37_00883 [Candidozyma auris]|uniref:Secreted protein n=1 Tax=Candidozyma auris TaxID=498019 RepID=A0A0L0P7I8_CANAR|nr:hypothetical protein QG37_00883 [[Candida] auris]
MKWIFCLIGGIGGTFCGPNDISAWTSRGEDKRKQNEAVAKKKRKKRNRKKKEKKKKKIEKKRRSKIFKTFGAEGSQAFFRSH